MQHPDDNNVAWLPKLIVLIGLFTSCAVVLLLPFDASMSQSCDGDPNCNAISVMGDVWKAMFLAQGIMCLTLIPFAFFWYETDDEEAMVSRIGTAICWSIVNAGVFLAILVGMYITSGFVDLNVRVLAPYNPTVQPALTQLKEDDPLEYAKQMKLITPTLKIGFYSATDKKPAWADARSMPTETVTQTIKTSWVVYILALLSFMGWCLMTIFAGLGMVSLPMDMIAAWYNRPQPIDLKQFAEKKLVLKKRCEELINVGKETKDKFKSKPNRYRETRFTNRFKKMVMELEDEMEVLNLCYKKNEINPLLPWFNLFGGIFCGVLTFSWWIQIIVEVFLEGLVYLSSVFSMLTGVFPLFGIVAYGIFAFYIMICCVKGSITFAGRFFLISLHPMKVQTRARAHTHTHTY